jgi:subtilisin family serine protease
MDGRLKPEVLAMGLDTATVSLADKNGYINVSGASMATPVMAGAVACLLQVHPDWTVQQLRKALFFSGDFYRKHGKPDPLFIHGYGIPDVFFAAGLK